MNYKKVNICIYKIFINIYIRYVIHLNIIIIKSYYGKVNRFEHNNH